VEEVNQTLVDGLNRQLDSLYPNASKQLDRLGELPDAVREDVVASLLKYACQSQHIGNIALARKTLSTIPRPCLSMVLETAIQKNVDLSDEWEYRRLLELLREIESDLLSDFVNRGLASDDLEIRETAGDFRSGSIE